MEILTKKYDARIKAWNILIEISLGEYYSLSKDILENNEFQRNRVKSSSTVYSLLKEDLKLGCIIPPIVLALETYIDEKFEDKKVIELINQNKNKLIILDGLQRTYTIQDLLTELLSKKDHILSKVQEYPLRIELYTGLNKLGILYRMLTLNTGQTPMSTRHQIEIIYSDYIDQDIEDCEGIRLLKEVDNEAPNDPGQYKFKDIVDGFNSYIDRDYLTMNRFDILENIKSLEKLSKEQEGKDLFKEYLLAYDKFVKKMCELGKGWSSPNENTPEDLSAQPFGKDALHIFNKSQVMTAFGSAVGKLIELKTIENFEELTAHIIPKITGDNIAVALDTLIINLDKVRIRAKKIGNDQRLFFEGFFKALFGKEQVSESYLNLNKTVDSAMQRYNRETY